MFNCISSKKQFDEAEREGQDSDPSRASSPKSLIAQLKDIVLKISHSLHIKACIGSSHITEVDQLYPYVTNISELEFSGSQTATHESSESVRGFTSFHTTRHGSTLASEIVEEEEKGFREWVAEVDAGVHIIFQSLPGGGNIIVRIKFRRLFNRWQIQRWWINNYDRITELYNIQRLNQQNINITLPTKEDEIEEKHSNEVAQVDCPAEPSSRSGGIEFHATSSTTQATNTNVVAKHDYVARVDNEVDDEIEFADQAGVFITVRQLNDGRKELRRIRFSRKEFNDEDARIWWERNMQRVYAQYL